MEDLKQIIAKNILELRLSRNMTQLELGEQLNYSDKTISKWERAESSPDIASLLPTIVLRYNTPLLHSVLSRLRRKQESLTHQ